MAIEIVKNIEAICVDENCRGNGIGTLLLEYTKNICKTLHKKNNLCYNIKSWNFKLPKIVWLKK